MAKLGPMTTDDTRTPPVTFDSAAWIDAQVALYGPIASADALKALLGCRTLSALNHALAMREVGFATFTLPKRRGQFAFTSEVAAWLVEQRQQGISKAKRHEQSAVDEQAGSVARGKTDNFSANFTKKSPPDASAG